MRKIIFSVGLIYCSIFVTDVSAQTTSETGVESPRIVAREQIERQRQLDRQYERLKNVGEQPPVLLMNRRSLPFKTGLNREQKKRLQPGEEDFNSYTLFLQQPKTGLIKLFPDQGCEENANIVHADEKCLKWIPNSSFYSFREREHTSDFLSDIRYKDDFLVSDGILMQGILTRLGDTPLENINLSSDGMKFLVDYQPEADSAGALKQFYKLVGGVKVGKYEYKKTQAAMANTTYALRVIAYRGNLFQRIHGMNFNVVEGDKRTDLVLAFRIIRKNADDGSLTLLWKELDRKEAPKIIFPKKTKGK